MSWYTAGPVQRPAAHSSGRPPPTSPGWQVRSARYAVAITKDAMLANITDKLLDDH